MGNEEPSLDLDVDALNAALKPVGAKIDSVEWVPEHELLDGHAPCCGAEVKVVPFTVAEGYVSHCRSCGTKYATVDALAKH